jgi:hypothetical protein
MIYPVQKVLEQLDLVLAKDLKILKIKLEVSTFIKNKFINYLSQNYFI